MMLAPIAAIAPEIAAPTSLAAVLGPSETVPVEDGKLLLGTWQTILLVELDGPRAERRVAVQVIGV